MPPAQQHKNGTGRSIASPAHRNPTGRLIDDIYPIPRRAGNRL